MRWLREEFGEVRWVFVGVGGLLVYGITGYLLLGYHLAAALYNTVLVVTTVGFTPPAEPGTAERLFTSSMAMFGVAAFLAALAMISAALLEGRIGILTRRKRMDRHIASMSGHYIVSAYGRVGRAAARELEAEGIPFVVVDRLEELEDQMRSDGVVHTLGDPTDENVLRAVGVERARGLISAVDSDADNVYIVLTARSLNPNLFIVARASESAAADRLYRAGADRVVSPYVSSGRHMAMLALQPRVLDYLEIAGESTRLEEVLVEPASPLIGQSVAAASDGGTALVVRRADGRVEPNPRADLVLEQGDLLVLLGGQRPKAGTRTGRKPRAGAKPRAAAEPRAGAKRRAKTKRRAGAEAR
ncbi:MAG TPA: potassium channel protein [Actinomycetota bacterium]|nr:potassium channel protein [Actinomycetota bacterium]